MHRLMALALLVALVSSLGCERTGGSGTPAVRELSGRKIRVVATTGMIADLLGKIGGGRVQVTGLMGPGVDPHLYKASEGDVIRMASADVIFYNGLHLEGKMAEVFERMGRRIRTVAVTDGIPRERLLSPPEFVGAYDPHVWFDVSLWKEAAAHAAKALMEMDPEHAEVYRVNAGAYLEKLAELDGHVRKQAARVPPRQRVLITAHDAFNYFGRAYGFEVRGLQGISTVAEAGTADIQSLVRLILANRIPAVFVETSVPVRYIEALQEAVEAGGFRLRIGGSLYSDALGDPGTPEGTYIGMVRHNVDTIVAALAGSSRAGGPGSSFESRRNDARR
ncbi:MAG TPA: zinc ABC transporter substrate-binding protein [Candidatus Limnocylindrales bacterium]|nr:zinc ABC transporter substrate-binding protein [Candidatus Limnocylindrales bacterium]